MNMNKKSMSSGALHFGSAYAKVAAGQARHLIKKGISHVKKLSKSKYILGLQCPKALWLKIQSPELEAPVDEGTKHLFEMGHQKFVVLAKISNRPLHLGMKV